MAFGGLGGVMITTRRIIFSALAVTMLVSAFGLGALAYRERVHQRFKVFIEFPSLEFPDLPPGHYDGVPAYFENGCFAKRTESGFCPGASLFAEETADRNLFSQIEEKGIPKSNSVTPDYPELLAAALGTGNIRTASANHGSWINFGPSAA